MIPAASTDVAVRARTNRAQISWNSAIERKNMPDGIHSCQCVGTTAKWTIAAPSEAIAASFTASLLSVLVAALGATRPMMTALARTSGV
jgi:hypothetical protein